MNYREPGRVASEPPTPPPKPKPESRIKTFRFARMFWLVAAILAPMGLGMIVVAGYVAVFSDVVCTRTNEGASPTCVATERYHFEKTVRSFPLSSASVRKVEFSDDPDQFFVLLGNHELRANVDQDWASRTVSEATAFIGTPSATRWEARYWTPWRVLGLGVGGLAFFAVLAFFETGIVIEIDKTEHEVRTRSRRLLGRPRGAVTHALAEVKEAVVESIDDSEYHALILVRPTGNTSIASLPREDAERVASSINAFLKNVRRAPKPPPSTKPPIPRHELFSAYDAPVPAAPSPAPKPSRKEKKAKKKRKR